MKHHSTIVAALALTASLTAPQLAAATVDHAAMTPVTKTGTFVKLVTSSSFSMTVGKVSYVVKTDGMTHITLDHKAVKLAKLQKGDTVTAKGPVEMHTITASTVTAGM